MNNVLPNFGFQSNIQRQNTNIVDQIFRGEQNAINPLIVGQSILPSLNKNIPSVFQQLAQGNQGMNPNNNLLFRKVESLIASDDQFQKHDN